MTLNTASSVEQDLISSSKLLFEVWEKTSTGTSDDLCSWCEKPMIWREVTLTQRHIGAEPQGKEKQLKRSLKVVCIPCEHLKEKS